MTEAHRKLRDKLLRESGFVDLEDAGGNIEPLARSHGVIDPGRTERGYYDDLEAYYRLAGQFLHEHAFVDQVEARVWELHAEGASYTRIARTVKREIANKMLPKRPFYRRQVHVMVTRLRAAMLGQGGPRRGRRRDPGSLRSEGMRLGLVLLTPAAALALDHIRQRLEVSQAEAVRRGLLLLARATR